jgi:hypothetical protein
MRALSDGMQSHFRTLVESAIASYHKRTNRKAMEHHKQMEAILSSTVTTPNPSSVESVNSNPSESASLSLSAGAVKPDNRAFYALLFGPDVAQRVAAEGAAHAERMLRVSEVVEEKLREQLEQADESFKRGQKKTTKGTEKRADGSSSTVAGGGTVKSVADAGIPWWKKEVSATRGVLNVCVFVYIATAAFYPAAP